VSTCAPFPALKMASCAINSTFETGSYHCKAHFNCDRVIHTVFISFLFMLLVQWQQIVVFGTKEKYIDWQQIVEWSARAISPDVFAVLAYIIPRNHTIPFIRCSTCCNDHQSKYNQKTTWKVSDRQTDRQTDITYIVLVLLFLLWVLLSLLSLLLFMMVRLGASGTGTGIPPRSQTSEALPLMHNDIGGCG
jgi:hypothetical protein